MMHSNYRINEKFRFVYLAAVFALGLFCVALSAQGTAPIDAPSLIFDPVVTGQQVMPYTEFEKIAQESASQAEIPQAIITDSLRIYKVSRSNRVIRPQEWRFSWLAILYVSNIPFDNAVKFLSSIPFYPVDTGFLETMKEDVKANTADSAAGVSQPLLPGNGVIPPVVVFNPLPAYTEEARQARAEGTASIQAVIRKDGSVGNVKIIKGVGYGLDESALVTIRNQWRFQPGTLNNNPVDVQVTIEVASRLK